MSIVAPTSVYLYYDAHDGLLYVGITSRGIRRQREHNADKDWWRFVVRQEVEHYDTRDEALDRERTLIRMYAPPFNTALNPVGREARAIYLAAAETDAQLPRDKRIPLRIVPDRAADALTLITPADVAHVARRFTFVGDIGFPVSVSDRRKARRVAAARWGGHVMVRLRVPTPDQIERATLMFKHEGPSLRVKRIDLVVKGG
jgi:predicted GIY-YIG superfamily endonuclease